MVLQQINEYIKKEFYWTDTPIFILANKNDYFIIFKKDAITYGLNINIENNKWDFIPKLKRLQDLYNYTRNIYDKDNHKILLNEVNFYLEF